jgi:hypothetical protein
MKILLVLLVIVIYSCERIDVKYTVPDKLQKTDSIIDNKKDTIYYDTKCGCIVFTVN